MPVMTDVIDAGTPRFSLVSCGPFLLPWRGHKDQGAGSLSLFFPRRVLPLCFILRLLIFWLSGEISGIHFGIENPRNFVATLSALVADTPF
jgi:hypothetical protein